MKSDKLYYNKSLVSGEVFGEASLLFFSYRIYTAVTNQSSVFLIINDDVFYDCLSNLPLICLVN